MKWLRKWAYLLLLTGVGCVYLTCVDRWQVYGKPLEKAEGWHTASEPEAKEDGPAEENGNDVPEKDGTASTGHDGADGNGAEDKLPEKGRSENPEDGLTQPEGETDPEGESSAGRPDGGGEEEFPEEAAPGGEPVYVTVEDDYFSDAVFIGDSRTVGLCEYGGLDETASFYASTGLTIYKMFDAEIVSVPGERKKITVEEALSRNSFAKIYLMIGINEMGTGTVESFIAKYQEAVEHLQELQPEAVIYLQGIIKVSTERSQQGDYINNEGIVARNEGIARLADNVKVFYLDVNPLICDETGGLTLSYTFDGVHLKAKYIEIWKDYLKSHAILLD